MKHAFLISRSLILMILLFVSSYCIGGPSLCNQYGGQSPNFIIPDGATSSSLSTTNFYNVKILFLGDFIINTDINFSNCRLEFVDGYVTFATAGLNLKLVLSNSKVYSCAGEWSIQTYQSPNNHEVYVGGCHFQNFNQAFRLKGTTVGINSCIFDGGVDYTHGTVDLHNCHHSSDASIYNNTFNQVEGGTAIHSSEGSELFIWYNRINGGAEGIHCENSNIWFTDNTLLQVGTGINSSTSILTIDKFTSQNITNFDKCVRGIISNRDVSLDVSNQVFSCVTDSDLTNTTFARYTDNDFFDPALQMKRKTNIRSRTSNLILDGNHFANHHQFAIGVDVNGGNFRAAGNTQTRMISTPYNAYNVVAVPVVFSSNTMNNGSSYFSGIINGSYLSNTSTNNLLREAWKSQTSPAGLYCDNNITSPNSRGMFFDGNNMNTTLATTTLGNCITGIEINEVLGKQDRRGNKWTGTYSNVGAAYNGNSLNLPQSRFIARNLLPWTPSHTPSGLFVPTSITTINDCNSGLTENGGLTETDIKIIDGTDIWVKPVNEWIAKWYLYYKLYTNPVLLNNANASTWYNNRTGTDVEAVAMLSYHMIEAYKYNNEAQVIDLLDDMTALDPITQWSQMHQYFSNLQLGILSMNQHRNQHLTNALSYVNTISRATEYDALISDVYEPYITTLLDPTYVLTSAEQVLLEDVSHLCPEDFGFAVHTARYFTNTNDLYDMFEASCNTVIDFRSRKDGSDSEELTISPNPTTGVIHVTNAIDDEIQIYNHMGIMVQQTKASNRQIDISDQNPGIYYLKNGRSIHKIILIK